MATSNNVISVTFDANITGLDKINASMQVLKDTSAAMTELHTKTQTIVDDFTRMGEAGNTEFESLRTQTSDLSHEIGGVNRDIQETTTELEKRTERYQKMVTEAGSDKGKLATAESYGKSVARWASERAQYARERAESVVSTSEMFGISHGEDRAKIGSTGPISASVFDIKAEQKQLEGFTQQYRNLMAKWTPTMRTMISKAVHTMSYGEQADNKISGESSILNMGRAIRDGFTHDVVMGSGSNASLNYGVEQVIKAITANTQHFQDKHFTTAVKSGAMEASTGLSKKEMEMLLSFGITGRPQETHEDVVKGEAFKTMLKNAILAEVGVKNTSVWHANRGTVIESPTPSQIDLAYLMKGTGLEGFFDSSSGGIAAYEDAVATRNVTGRMLNKVGYEELNRRLSKSPMMMRAILAKEKSGKTSTTGRRMNDGSIQNLITDAIGLRQLGDNLVSEFLVRGNGQIDTEEATTDEDGNPHFGQTKLFRHLMTEGLIKETAHPETGTGIRLGKNIRYNNTRYGGQTEGLIQMLRSGYAEIERKKQDPDYVIPKTSEAAVGMVRRLTSRLKNEGTASEALYALSDLNDFLSHEEYFTNDADVASEVKIGSFVPREGVKEKASSFLIQKLYPFVGANDPKRTGAREFAKSVRLGKLANPDAKFDPTKPIRRAKIQTEEDKKASLIPTAWEAFTESGISRALGLNEADQNERTDLIQEISMEGIDPTKGMTDIQQQQLAMLMQDTGMYYKDPKTGKLIRNEKTPYVMHVAHGQSGVTARLIKRSAYEAVERNFAKHVTIPMAQHYGLIGNDVDISTPEGFKAAQEIASKKFGTFWNNLTPDDTFETGADYSGKEGVGIPDFSKMFDNRNKRWSPGIDLFGGSVDWLHAGEHGGIDINGEEVNFDTYLKRIQSDTKGSGGYAPRVKVVDLSTGWKKQYDYALKQYKSQFDPAEKAKLVEKHKAQILKQNPQIVEEELNKQALKQAEDEIAQMGEDQLASEGIREKAYGFDSALEGQAIMDASFMARGSFQGRGGLAGKGTVSSQKDMIKRLAMNARGKKAGVYDPFTKHTTYSVDMPSAFGGNVTLWSEYDDEGNMVASNADMIVDKSMQKDYKNFKDKFVQGTREKLTKLSEANLGPESYTEDEKKQFRENLAANISANAEARVAQFRKNYKAGKVGITSDEYTESLSYLEDALKATEKYYSDTEEGKHIREKMVESFKQDQVNNPTGDEYIARALADEQLRRTKTKPIEDKIALIKGAWALPEKKAELRRLEDQYSENGFAGAKGGLLEQLIDKYTADVEHNPKLSVKTARSLALKELGEIRDRETRPLAEEIAQIESVFGTEGLHYGDLFAVATGDKQFGLQHGIAKIRNEALDEYEGTLDPKTGLMLDRFGHRSELQRLNDRMAKGGEGAPVLSPEQIEVRAKSAADEAMSAMYAINGLYALSEYKDDKGVGSIGAQASQWLRFSPGVMKHQAEAYNEMMADLRPGNIEGIRKRVFGATGDDTDSFLGKGLSGPGAEAFYQEHKNEIDARVEKYKRSMLDRTMKGEFIDYTTGSGDVISSDSAENFGLKNRRFVTNAWMARNINLNIDENEKSLAAWTKLMSDPDELAKLKFDDNDIVTSGFFKGMSREAITEGRSRIDVAKQAFEESTGRKFDYRQVLGMMTLAGYGKEGDKDYLPAGFVDFKDTTNVAGALQRSPTGFDQFVAGLNYNAIGLGEAFKKLTSQETGVMLNMTDMQRLAGGDWDGDMVKRMLAGKYNLERINEIRRTAKKPLPELKSNKEIFDWVTTDPEGYRMLREAGAIGGDKNSIVDDVFNTIQLVKQVGLFSDKDKQGRGSSKDQMEDETDLLNKVRASKEQLTGITSIDMVKDINRRIKTPAQMGLTSAIGARLSSIDIYDPKNAFWAKLAMESNRLYDIYTTQAKRPHEMDFDKTNFAALSLGQEWSKMAKFTEGMWDVKEGSGRDDHGNKVKFYTNGKGQRIADDDLYVSEHGYGAIDISKGNLGGKTSNGGFKLDTTQFMSRSNRMNIMEAIIAQAAQNRGNLDTSVAEFYKELYTGDVAYEKDDQGNIILDDSGHGKVLKTKSGHVAGIGYGLFDVAKRADGGNGLSKVKRLMKNARGIRAYNQGGMHMILSEEDRNTLQQQMIEAGEEIDAYVDELYNNPELGGGMFETDDNGNFVLDKNGEKKKIDPKAYANQLRRQAGFEQVKMLIGHVSKKGKDGQVYNFGTGMTMSGTLDYLANSGNLTENSMIARMLLANRPKNEGSALIDETYDRSAARQRNNLHNPDFVEEFNASEDAIVANAIKLGVDDLLPQEYQKKVKDQRRKIAEMKAENAAAEKEAADKAAQAATPKGQSAPQVGQQAGQQAGQEAAQVTSQAEQKAAEATAEKVGEAAEAAAEATAEAVGAGTPGTPSTPSGSGTAGAAGTTVGSEDLNKAIAAGMDEHTLYTQMHDKWEESMKYVSRNEKKERYINDIGYTLWQGEKDIKNSTDIMDQYITARSQLTQQRKSGNVNPLLEANVTQMKKDLPIYVQGLGLGAYNSAIKLESDIGDIIGKGKASGSINQLKAMEDKNKSVNAKINSAETLVKAMKEGTGDFANWKDVANNTEWSSKGITSAASAEDYISRAKAELEKINATYQTAYTSIMNNVVTSLEQQNQSIEQSITGISKQPFSRDARSKQQRILTSMSNVGTQIVQQEQALLELKNTDFYQQSKPDSTLRKMVAQQEKELKKRKAQYGDGSKNSDMWKILEAKDKQDAYEYRKENRDNGLNAIESSQYKFKKMITYPETYDEDTEREITVRDQMIQANSALKARRKMIDARRHDSRYQNKGSKFQTDTDLLEAQLIKDEAMYGTGDERSVLWQNLRSQFDRRLNNQLKRRVDTSAQTFDVQQAKVDQFFKMSSELGTENQYSKESVDLNVAQSMASLGNQIESERQRIAKIKSSDPQYARSKKAFLAGDKEGEGAYYARINSQDSYWGNMQNDFTSGSAERKIRDRIERERQYALSHRVDTAKQEFDISKLGVSQLFSTSRELGLENAFSKESMDASVNKYMQSLGSQISAGYKKIRDTKKYDPAYQAAKQAYAAGERNNEKTRAYDQVVAEEAYWNQQRTQLNDGTAERGIRNRLERERKYALDHRVDTSEQEFNNAKVGVNQLYNTNRELGLENRYSKESINIAVDKALQGLGSQISAGYKRLDNIRKNDPEYQKAKEAYDAGERNNYKTAAYDRVIQEQGYWDQQRTYLNDGTAEIAIRDRMERERKYLDSIKVNTLSTDQLLGEAAVNQKYFTRQELGLNNRYSVAATNLAVQQDLSSLSRQVEAEQKRIQDIKENDSAYQTAKEAYDADKTEARETSDATKRYREVKAQEDYWAQRREEINTGTAEANIRSRLEKERQYELANKVDVGLTTGMQLGSLQYNYNNLTGHAAPKYSFEDRLNRVQSRYMQIGRNLNDQNVAIEQLMGTDEYAKSDKEKQRVDALRESWKAKKEDYDKGMSSNAWKDAAAMTDQEMAAMQKAQELRDKASASMLDKQGERFEMQAHRYNNQFLAGNFFGQVYQRMDNRREQIKVAREQVASRKASVDAEIAQMEGYKDTNLFDEAHYKALKEQSQKLQDQDDVLATREGQQSGFSGYMGTLAKTLGGNVLSLAVNKTIQLFKKLGKEAIQFQGQWQTAMSGVSAKSGLTGTALQEMGDKIEKQATRLKVSSTTLAATYKQLFAAGFDTSNIEEAAEAMTKFSTVTGQDMTKSIRQLTQIVKSGLVSSLSEATDMLTAVSDISTSSAADISKVLSKMSGSAIASGLSSAETAGLATFATDTLGGSSTAGNDINLILTRMSAITSGGASGEEVFVDSDGRKFSTEDLYNLQKTTGVNFMTSDMTDLLSPIEMMKNIAAQWQDMTETQRTSFTTLFGGSSGRQSSTFSTLMNSLSIDPDLLDTYINAAKDSEGTVDYQYTTMKDTAASDWQQAKSAMTDFFSNLGGGSNGWFNTLSSSLAKSITGLFGGVTQEIEPFDLSEAFTFNISNFQSGIDALEEIKNKYTDLTDTLSAEDQEDVTNIVNQLAAAFPNLSEKISTSVLNMEELVKLLEQLNIEKEKLIGNNAQEERDLSDYEAITKKYQDAYDASSYSYVRNLSSQYNTTSANNWKKLAAAYQSSGGKWGSTRSVARAVMDEGDWIVSALFGGAYDKYGNNRTTLNKVEAALNPMLRKMNSGELTYETMSVEQKGTWEQYMELAYNWLTKKIAETEDPTLRAQYVKTLYSYFPHAKSASEKKQGQEDALTELVNDMYTYTYGNYTDIDDTAKEYFKEQIRNYLLNTYGVEGLNASGFTLSGYDADQIWQSTKQWFTQGTDAETGETVYGDFNKKAFQQSNPDKYAKYWYNGMPLVGDTPEEAAEYYQKYLRKQQLGERLKYKGSRVTDTAGVGIMSRADIMENLTDKYGQPVLTTLGEEIGANNATKQSFTAELAKMLQFFSTHSYDEALGTSFIDETSWAKFGLANLGTTYTGVNSALSTYKNTPNQQTYDALIAEVNKQYLTATTGTSTDISSALSNLDTAYATAQSAVDILGRYNATDENGNRQTTAEDINTVAKATNKSIAEVEASTTAITDYTTDALNKANITYQSAAAIIEAELNSANWGGTTAEEIIKNAAAEYSGGSAQAGDYIKAWNYLQKYAGSGLGYSFDESTGKWSVTADINATKTTLDTSYLNDQVAGFDYTSETFAAPYLRQILQAGTSGKTALKGITNREQIEKGLVEAYPNLKEYWNILDEIDQLGGLDKVTDQELKTQYLEYKIKLSFQVNGINDVVKSADTVEKITKWSTALMKGGEEGAKAEAEISNWSDNISTLYGVNEALTTAGGDVSKMEPVMKSALLSQLQSMGYQDIDITDLYGPYGSYIINSFQQYAESAISDYIGGLSYIDYARTASKNETSDKFTMQYDSDNKPYFGDLRDVNKQYASRWELFSTGKSTLPLSAFGLTEYDPLEIYKVNGMTYPTTQQFYTNAAKNSNFADNEEYYLAQDELLQKEADIQAGIGAALSLITGENGIDLSKYAGLTPAAKEYIQQQTKLSDYDLMYNHDYAMQILADEQAIRTGEIAEWETARAEYGYYETNENGEYVLDENGKRKFVSKHNLESDQTNYDLFDAAIESAKQIATLTIGLTDSHYFSNIDELVANAQSSSSATRASAVSSIYEGTSTMSQNYAFAQQIYKKAVTDKKGIAGLSADELNKLMTETNQSYTSITGTNGLTILQNYVDYVNGNMDSLTNDLVTFKIAQMQQAFNAAEGTAKAELKQQYKDLGFKFITDSEGKETDQISTDISGVSQETIDSILAAYGYSRTQEYEDPNSKYGFLYNTMQTYAGATGVNAEVTKAKALTDLATSSRTINELSGLLGGKTLEEAWNNLDYYQQGLFASYFGTSVEEVKKNKSGYSQQFSAGVTANKNERDEMITSAMTQYGLTEKEIASMSDKDKLAWANKVVNGNTAMPVTEGVKELAAAYVAAAASADSAATAMEKVKNTAAQTTSTTSKMFDLKEDIADMHKLSLEGEAAAQYVEQLITNASFETTPEGLEEILETVEKIKNGSIEASDAVKELITAAGYSANYSNEEVDAEYNAMKENYFKTDENGNVIGFKGESASTKEANYLAFVDWYNQTMGQNKKGMKAALDSRYSWIGTLASSGSYSDDWFTSYNNGAGFGYSQIGQQENQIANSTDLAAWNNWVAQQENGNNTWFSSNVGSNIQSLITSNDEATKLNAADAIASKMFELEENIAAANKGYYEGNIFGKTSSEFDEYVKQNKASWEAELANYKTMMTFLGTNYSDVSAAITTAKGNQTSRFDATTKKAMDTAKQNANKAQIYDNMMAEITSQYTTNGQLNAGVTKEQIKEAAKTYLYGLGTEGENLYNYDTDFLSWIGNLTYDKEHDASYYYDQAMSQWDYGRLTGTSVKQARYFSDEQLEAGFKKMQEGTDAWEKYLEENVNEADIETYKSRMKERYGQYATSFLEGTLGNTDNIPYLIRQAKATAKKEDIGQLYQAGTITSDVSTFLQNIADAEAAAATSDEVDYTTYTDELLTKGQTYTKNASAIGKYDASQKKLADEQAFLTELGIDTTNMTSADVSKLFATKYDEYIVQQQQLENYFTQIYEQLTQEQREALGFTGEDSFFNTIQTGAYSGRESAADIIARQDTMGSLDLWSKFSDVNARIEAGTLTEEQGRTEISSLVDSNVNIDNWIQKSEEATEIMREYREGLLTAEEAQRKLAKTMNRSSKTTAEYNQNAIKLNKSIKNYQYYLNKTSWNGDEKDEAAALVGYKDWDEAKASGETELSLRATISDLQIADLDDLQTAINNQIEAATGDMTAIEMGGDLIVRDKQNVILEAGGNASEVLAGANAEMLEIAQAWADRSYTVEYAKFIQYDEDGNIMGYKYAVANTPTITGAGTSGARSSSGGGGGKSAADKLVEKWKHKVSDKEHVIKMVQAQETKYQEQGQLANYGNMLTVENKAQEDLISTQKQAIKEYKNQLKSVSAGSDDYYTLTDAIKSAEEAIEEAENAIIKNTKALKENRAAMRKTRTELEDYLKGILEANEQYEEQKLAGTVEMEDTILEAIKARYQEEWNLQKEDLEKKKAALEDEKELISERLQARKDAEDAADEYEEIAELQKQLALISMDSTRAAEAEQIRKQLAEKTNALAWEEAETYAETRQKELEDEANAIDEYISDEDERVEDYLADANNFSAAVKEVLGGTQDQIIQWLKDNVDAYDTYLSDAQEQQINTWLETYKKMMGITDTYWEQINNIIKGGWTAVAQEVTTSQDYINSSNTGKLQMLRDAKDKYDEYYNAYYGTSFTKSNFDTLTDTYITQMEEALASGDEEKLSNLLTSYEEDMEGNATYTHSDNFTAGSSSSTTATKNNTDAVKSNTDAQKALKTAVDETTNATKSSSTAFTNFINTVTTTATSFANVIGTGISNLTNIFKNVGSTNDDDTNRTRTMRTAANGGVFNYTGQVLVHGTNEHPEYVFNEDQLKALSKIGYTPYNASVGGDVFGSSNSIGDVSITINQAEIASDIDVQKLAEQVGEQFVQQISIQGYRTGRY